MKNNSLKRKDIRIRHFFSLPFSTIFLMKCLVMLKLEKGISDDSFPICRFRASNQYINHNLDEHC